MAAAATVAAATTTKTPHHAHPRRERAPLVLRGASLLYLGVMVVLPMLAMTVQAFQPGPRAFWSAVTEPYAWHALKLTFATAFIMVIVGAITGTATAWVIVRYEFPGRGLVNALIDLPFAVPTVVTGVMLVALYGPDSVVGAIMAKGGWRVVYNQPGIILALLFVTYPFVIRSVQPVLLALDRTEEEAAATLGAGPMTTFLRITLPTLWPSILTGSALSFSRALGEYGSVVMIAGNQPMLTKTAPIYVFGEIESGNRHGALAVSAVLLATSLLILVVLNALQRGREIHDAA
ncbi:sulfate ABC transporter permease subunit CysT [Paludisphaera rhizosphaerae]|uniref:sulfate ABC transporter permease subunit CysT n=1 Tax=Paludisphaera rhizosphaerae TaxID=2711216 RepID=UPI0013ECD976|nr:sulfate ABC transporter permease subunit CysT [Paludisphaera rhizosphaerae]